MARIRGALLAIALIGPACCTAAAYGQGFGGPSCFGELGIDKPRYLGKQAGKDAIELSWSVGGLGTSGGLQPGFGANPALACAEPAGLRADFQVALTVVRKLGHRDSGSAQVSGPLGSNFQRNVQVQRAALETDPKSYEIQVNGPVTGTFTVIAKAAGSGLPTIPGASLATSSAPPLGASCQPPFAVTALSLGPSADVVNVAWSPPAGSQICTKVNTISVQVKLVRADGTTILRNAAATPGATTAQVLLGQPAGQVTSFEVTVSALLSRVVTLRGNTQGDF